MPLQKLDREVCFKARPIAADILNDVKNFYFDDYYNIHYKTQENGTARLYTNNGYSLLPPKKTKGIECIITKISCYPETYRNFRCSYQLIYNSDELLNAIKTGIPLGDRNFIVTTVLKMFNSPTSVKFFKEIGKPVKYPIPSDFEVPQKFLTKTLFNYQKENIKWMLNIENTLPKLTFIPDKFKKLTDEEDIYIDTSNYIFCKELDIEKTNYQICGGGLLDEMGLGKSICISTLHLMNPCKVNLLTSPVNNTNLTETTAFDNTRCNAWIKSKKRFCIKPPIEDTGYCKRHGKMPKDKICKPPKVTVHDLKDKPVSPEEYNFTVGQLVDSSINHHLRSKSTLIACPNHLCSQWKQELRDYSTKGRKITVIASVTDFKRSTYYDLVTSDFVIVTFNFLKSSHYRSLFLEYNIKESEDYDQIEYIGVEKTRQQGLLKETCPILHLIYWHRIVVDEIQEVYNFPVSVHRFLECFYAKYRWIISGSLEKFCNSSMLLRFIQNCNIYQKIGESVSENNFKFVKCEELPLELKNFAINNAFRRNTKQSVESEFVLPDIQEEVYFLTMSKTEKAMYDSRDLKMNNLEQRIRDDYIRQLCCHPNISNKTAQLLEKCKTLDEIQQVMSDNIKNKITKIEKRILEYAQTVTDLENQIANAERAVANNQIPAYMLRELRYQKTRTNTNIDKEKIHLEHLKTSMNYFNTVVPKIESNDLDTCSVCLGDIEEKDIGVTRCGHIYCYSECLCQLLAQIGRCSVCQNPLKNSDIFHVVTKQDLEKKQPSTELEKLIEVHGTKMANLILYIRKFSEKTEEKAIIFSQWDNLLQLVNVTLKEEKIPTVLCRGSVYQKSSAIRKFSNDPSYRVILLSSKNAASGINLTKATRIIFIDPVYGTPEYKQKQEEQAIGRSHRLGQTKPITVVRFIMKDTIEEDIHKWTANEEMKDKPNNCLPRLNNNTETDATDIEELLEEMDISSDEDW